MLESSMKPVQNWIWWSLASNFMIHFNLMVVPDGTAQMVVRRLREIDGHEGEGGFVHSQLLSLDHDIWDAPVDKNFVNQMVNKKVRFMSINCWIFNILFMITSTLSRCLLNTMFKVCESVASGSFKVNVCCLKSIRTMLGTQVWEITHRILINISKWTYDFDGKLVLTPNR